jgi:hypothetical protein
MNQSGNQIWDEADIGSGEKTAGQRETEEMIRQIPALPDDSDAANDDDGDDGSDDGSDDDSDDDVSAAADDVDAAGQSAEQERSLEKDEADNGLDQLDPVPPKG